MPTEVELEVQRFFDRYASLVIKDAESFCKCWSFPGHSLRDWSITEPTLNLGVFPNYDEFLHGVKAADRFFMACGFRTVRIQVAAVTVYSERVLQADTRWEWLDAEGRCTADTRAIYTLGRFDDELRNCQVIWLGIVPREIP